MGSWTWLGRYALILLAAIALGAGIAELTVFKQTTLWTPRLTAAALARFLGYGGALVILWMIGERTGRQLRGPAAGTAHLGILVLPLSTLVALSVGYDILLAVLRPFLAPSMKDGYNWAFVLAITASAVWLVVALYRHAEGLIELLRAVPMSVRPARQCASCGARLSSKAKFCATCGKATD